MSVPCRVADEKMRGFVDQLVRYLPSEVEGFRPNAANITGTQREGLG